MSRSPVLCFGETLVDLICPEPVAHFEQATRFVPYPGGAATNVAVTVALEGVPVYLLGGVGDDAWGHWLKESLDGIGIDLSFWSIAADRETAVAFVTIDADAYPSFMIYGRGIEEAIVSNEPILEEAIASASALWISSNTIIGHDERRVTHRAKELAHAYGCPVIVDANIRKGRWSSLSRALEETARLAADAFLVKMNHDEAALLTGMSDPVRACERVLDLGCKQAVVTRGKDGIVLRGAVSCEYPAAVARPVDTTGGGDAVTGVLLGCLWASDFRLESLEPGIPRAMERAARCVEEFGALSHCLRQGGLSSSRSSNALAPSSRAQRRLIK